MQKVGTTVNQKKKKLKMFNLLKSDESLCNVYTREIASYNIILYSFLFIWVLTYKHEFVFI